MDILPDVRRSSVGLVIAPGRAAQDILTEITARLAVAGPVDIVVAGNRLDAYRMARAIRRQSSDLAGALQRIHLARAFTCYQVVALLAHSPANPTPKLILELLATFYDEGVAVAEALRLLQESIHHLHRLSRIAPLIVFAQPPPTAQPERAFLMERLQEVAGNVWVYRPQHQESQARLF